MMKGYYGEEYEPQMLLKSDYDEAGQRKPFVHTVNYDGIWAELNLFSDDVPLKLKNYKALRVEFAEPVNTEAFVIKVYGDGETVQEVQGLSSGLTTAINFSDLPITKEVNRITLQHTQEGKAEAKVISAWLIRHDGTEEYSDLSPFWGCEITDVTKLASTAINPAISSPRQANAAIFNLAGQRLSSPQRGINIIGGRKVVVK